MIMEEGHNNIDFEKFEVSLWKYLSKQVGLNDDDLNPTKDCKRIHQGIMRLAKRAIT